MNGPAKDSLTLFFTLVAVGFLLVIGVVYLLEWSFGEAKHCLHSHEEPFTYLQPVQIGSVDGTPTFIYVTQTGHYLACDKWKE